MRITVLDELARWSITRDQGEGGRIGPNPDTFEWVP